MKTSNASQSGFTLVEVMVATFVFSIIVLATSGLFTQILNNERRAFAAQKIQENGLYVLELLTREIRVSSIVNQDSTDCSATSLTISHPLNGTVTYSLSNGVLRRTADGVATDLTSSDVQLSRLNFCVLGSGASDNATPRVTIIGTMQNRTGKDIVTFNLETTVSSRDIGSEL
ncbi:MAG TPA: prepilin-type N-terminal cleavage/methylation domain-containing protein [Candidatus Paceibacterota bacterium]|nr:prepilin-type N-terminal cleavage/methylation domain-containing protein [Candidatus Paceibacterota bacterium]